MEEPMYFGKNISILHRQANRFYDRELSPYQIGCGQQFFLIRIYENQGLSMYDLARMGVFDKGTVTRATQKLEEEGYIRSEPDEHDKRVRRLYATEKAVPIVAEIYAARNRWNAILTQNMTQAEQEQVYGLLVRMGQNALRYVEQEERKD